MNARAVQIFFDSSNSRSKEVRVLQRRNFDQWDAIYITLYGGARVMINLNCNKAFGEVNGAQGVVVRFFMYSVVVKLDSGRLAVVTPRQMQRDAVVRGFPLELSYACTIAKMQGRTLSAAATNPDLGAPAVGCAAVSRAPSLNRLFRIS